MGKLRIRQKSGTTTRSSFCVEKGRGLSDALMCTLTPSVALLDPPPHTNKYSATWAGSVRGRMSKAPGFNVEVLPLRLLDPDVQAASGLAPPKELVPVGRVVQCQQHNFILLALPMRLLRHFHLALSHLLVVAQPFVMNQQYSASLHPQQRAEG